MHLPMHVNAEGATGFSLPVLEDGEVSWREKQMCFVFLLRFTYLFIFCMMINCTVFREAEMLHATVKEQQSRRPQFGKQLEHLKIKGRNGNDRVLGRINFLFII